jgi:hypothetical protein
MSCWFVNNFVNNVLTCTTHKIGIFGVMSCENLKKNLQYYKNWSSSIIIQRIIFHYIWLVVCEELSFSKSCTWWDTHIWLYVRFWMFSINLKPHNKIDDCEKPQLFVSTNKFFNNQHHFPCNLSIARSLLEKFS